MIKSQLAANLAIQAGIHPSVAAQVVDIFFQAMIDTMLEGGNIEIRGFGTFYIKEYRAYTGRNPQTGAMVPVKSKRLPCWKMGKELRERMRHSGRVYPQLKLY